MEQFLQKGLVVLLLNSKNLCVWTLVPLFQGFLHCLTIGDSIARSWAYLRTWQKNAILAVFWVPWMPFVPSLHRSKVTMSCTICAPRGSSWMAPLSELGHCDQEVFNRIYSFRWRSLFTSAIYAQWLDCASLRCYFITYERLRISSSHLKHDCAVTYFLA